MAVKKISVLEVLAFGLDNFRKLFLPAFTYILLFTIVKPSLFVTSHLLESAEFNQWYFLFFLTRLIQIAIWILACQHLIKLGIMIARNQKMNFYQSMPTIWQLINAFVGIAVFPFFLFIQHNLFLGYLFGSPVSQEIGPAIMFKLYVFSAFLILLPIIAMVFGLFLPIIADQNKNLIQACKESFFLVEGNRLRIGLLFFIFAALHCIVYITLQDFDFNIPLNITSGIWWWRKIIIGMLSACSAISLAHVYMQLKK